MAGEGETKTLRNSRVTIHLPGLRRAAQFKNDGLV